MIWVVVVVAVIVVAALVIALRRPRQEPGVASFRRHIDALSPEARREVMDRVRPPADPNPTPPNHPDDQEETGL